MKRLAIAGLLVRWRPHRQMHRVNAGEQKPETDLPFNMTKERSRTCLGVIAFLPDGRMLITEKVGPVWL